MSFDGYKRNIESYAIELLSNFPVLAILGARQVGKTWLSRRWPLIFIMST